MNLHRNFAIALLAAAASTAPTLSSAGENYPILFGIQLGAQMADQFPLCVHPKPDVQSCVEAPVDSSLGNLIPRTPPSQVEWNRRHCERTNQVRIELARTVYVVPDEGVCAAPVGEASKVLERQTYQLKGLPRGGDIWVEAVAGRIGKVTKMLPPGSVAEIRRIAKEFEDTLKAAPEVETDSRNCSGEGHNAICWNNYKAHWRRPMFSLSVEGTASPYQMVGNNSQISLEASFARRLPKPEEPALRLR